MTDINYPERLNQAAEPSPAEGFDRSIPDLIELLFFAYRDFTSEPDSILASHGFGRAHHRVIHFVGRNPGITVAELLSILRITKQSLARVLRQLVHENFIVQEVGRKDRRQRLLYLTAKGRTLHDKLSEPQQERFRKAISVAGHEQVEGFRQVLYHLIDEGDRDAIHALLDREMARPQIMGDNNQ